MGTMRIVSPGGTGQVGTLLARAFLADGHEVVVLGRRPAPAPWPAVACRARPLRPLARTASARRAQGAAS
jgi:uncharacterized protein YbjT (DUF2867 family)